MTVELVDYECRRNLDAFGGGVIGVHTRQCRGRMVATFDVVLRVPVLTCDACGRVALAELL